MVMNKLQFRPASFCYALDIGIKTSSSRTRYCEHMQKSGIRDNRNEDGVWRQNLSVLFYKVSVIHLTDTPTTPYNQFPFNTLLERLTAGLQPKHTFMAPHPDGVFLIPTFSFLLCLHAVSYMDVIPGVKQICRFTQPFRKNVGVMTNQCVI